MVKYLIVIAFSLAAVLFMAISLHFSRYKRRKADCCSHGLEEHSRSTDHSQACRACTQMENKMK